MKYKTATGKALLSAYSKAVRLLCKDGRATATKQSAGFIMPAAYEKGEGFQVFVSVERFSEKKLKADPMSGGLI